MKILVIQHKMIGDVLISSIICNNLKIAYPDAQIDYLVNKNTVDVLEGNKSISNLIIFDPIKDRKVKDLIAFSMRIRKEKYDIVIDAYSKLQSWVISFFSGANQKISYKKWGRNWIYTTNVPYAEFPDTHLGLAIERRLSLIKPLFNHTDFDAIPKLFLSEKEKQFAYQIFEKHQVNSSKKTVMISLLGSEKIKTYPLNFMAKLVDFIGTNYDVNILFNYFPSQIEDAKIVYNLCSQNTKEKIHFDLLGNNLREFIAIMNSCDFIFGNDGGAINMAKALNKPSFIVFSPWIEKKIWATFEDGRNHTSVHLNDFQPELFYNKSEAKLKSEALQLYENFNPELILPKLKSFLITQLK